MHKILKKIITINQNRQVIEPFVIDATTASVADVFNLIPAVASLAGRDALASFLFPNLYSVVFKEETRRLTVSVEAIKKNRKNNNKNAIPDLIQSAVNNFESFKAIEKDLLLIEDDEEWNEIVTKVHGTSTIKEVFAIKEIFAKEETPSTKETSIKEKT
jgi:hypothetical protein